MLRAVMPLAFYFVMLNHTFYLLEAIYYYAIGNVKRNYGFIKMATRVVLMISLTFLVWGLKIERSDSLKEFKAESSKTWDRNDFEAMFI